MKHALTLLLSEMNTYLMHSGTPLAGIYKAFDRVDRILDKTLAEQDWIRSVISRAYQYQRYILVDFEKLRVIHDYRTPSALRAYGLFFLTLTPVFMGPLFAKYSRDYGYWSGIYIAALVAMMMSSLYAIQMDQEDPFDAAGVDDLNMHVLDEPPFYMWEPRDRRGAASPEKGPQPTSIPVPSAPAVHSAHHLTGSIRGSHSRRVSTNERRPNTPPPSANVSLNSSAHSSTSTIPEFVPSPSSSTTSPV